MIARCIISIIVFRVLTAQLQAQTCTTLGQTPSTAFPVCGTSSFVQNNVPLCGGTNIPTTCTGGTYGDFNPFYYRFTCFTGGTLGFIIDPMNNADDYDWVIFDITGRNPNDIYTMLSLNICENWSANPGNTGTSNNLNGLRNCAGNTPNFSSYPTLIAGHDYLMMVSNWSASQVGYTLTFGGGTAVITDPVIPTVQSASINCEGTELTVRFNKKIRCNSLVANGSDFTIAGGTIVFSAGFGCSSSFDLDSAIINISPALTAGNYSIAIASGTDGNTLLDNCNTAIATGTSVPFTVLPQSPLAMATITSPSCPASTITLNFSEPVKCSSIAANGSDFTISGASTVSITGASPSSCNANAETNTITLQLSAPLAVAGSYQVQAAVGSDGNTIIASCNRQLSAGSSANFVIPSAAAIAMGTLAPLSCAPTTLSLTFINPVLCSSIAPNGSDFIISGSSSVNITGALPVACNASGETNTITIQLASPIIASGTYSLQATTGSDGNSLFGSCGASVAPGSNVQFTIAAQPALAMGQVASTTCSPSSIILNFTDTINCNSIALNGSDFRVTGPSAVSVSGATATCVSQQTRSINITFSTPITTGGSYQVEMAVGTDGNTLTGNCGRQITVGDVASFVIPDAVPALLDSITAVGCKPNSLQVVLDSPVLCSSIAANGSDFRLVGPSGVSIISASGICDANGLTSRLTLQLSGAIVVGGNYQVQLVAGTDGNTLINQCNRSTPVSMLSFEASDSVSANFQYTIDYDCETDLIHFLHDGRNDVDQWTWTVNGTPASTSQTFTQSFSATSNNQVQLTVRNDRCADSRTVNIALNNKVTASFESPEIICPEDTAIFINRSTGGIDNWHWSFGNGSTSNVQHPGGQLYPVTGSENLYQVSLTVSNSTGCSTTATQIVKVLSGCNIAVPNAFTPNNDGLNDYLYPINAIKAEQLEFKVFNRWGQLVFYSKDWTRKWDGRINGLLQAGGVYVWTLNYTHRDTRVKYSLKGTSVLIR